jgi:hypothetical protein
MSFVNFHYEEMNNINTVHTYRQEGDRTKQRTLTEAVVVANSR